MNEKQLEQAVFGALDGTGYFRHLLSSGKVTVEAKLSKEEEVITLRGEVRSFHLKSVAQTAARINGCRVENLINVTGYGQ
jgi:hypothetical protein